jgi:hypothetical protein
MFVFMPVQCCAIAGLGPVRRSSQVAAMEGSALSLPYLQFNQGTDEKVPP